MAPRRSFLVAVVCTLAWGCSETSSPTAAVATTAQPVVAECGGKGLPDCPLQGWMKDSVRAYMNAGDNTRLAEALDKLAKHAPDGYSGWDASAKRGADAARAGDIVGVKAECKSCHDQFRERFRSEMRGVPLF